MIKAKDLRIGNYVNNYYKGIEVVSVGLLNLLEQYNPNEHQQIYSGIPLTEEILLTCGANKIADRTYTIGNNYQIEITYNHNNYILQIFDEMVYKPFEHLHQLQNLYFALTGEELHFKP